MEKKQNSDRIIYLLFGTIIVLMLMNFGLFLQMRNLQRDVIEVLLPFKDASLSMETLPKGIPAPGFETIDTTGNEISLEKYLGTNVLLFFSSPTCPACQAIYPVLKEFSVESQDIELVLLSNGNDEQNRRLVLEYGFEFPVVKPTKELAERYLISTVPFVYLIDENGLIVSGSVVSTYEQLVELLDSH
jgi:methylamine dehydrogenase accessory protein MauD